jgi:hypothetical protein
MGAQMTEEPTVKSTAPDSPPYGAEGNRPPAAGSAHGAWAARVAASPSAATRPTRSRRKKILVPVVLAVIGLGLFAAGWLMYPRRAEPPIPSSDSLEINGVGSTRASAGYVDSHMGIIYYTVQQLHPDIARLIIDVILNGASVPHGAQVAIQLYRPALTVLRCSPGCVPGNGSASALARFGSLSLTATFNFVVKAHSYGVVANGATATAAFPQVIFTGTQQATMFLYYYGIPAANTYDWSANPPLHISKSLTEWDETLAPSPPGAQLPRSGEITNGRVATGIDHAAQQQDSNFTLAAGILFGIGGGALVAAVQEALHD